MKALKIAFFIVSISILVDKSLSTEDDDVDDRPGGSYVYENTRPSQRGIIPQWDENGYVFFCLCMGEIAYPIFQIKPQFGYKN